MERRAEDTLELHGALGETIEVAEEARRNALFAGVLASQVLVFAAAAASGNIPHAVLILFRALLTL
jgi:hypothetical protein